MVQPKSATMWIFVIWSHQKAPEEWPPGGAFALLGTPLGLGASPTCSWAAATFSPAAPVLAGFAEGSRGANGFVLRSFAFWAEAEFFGTMGAGAGASKPMLDFPPGGASTLLLFLSPIPEKSSVVVDMVVLLPGGRFACDCSQLDDRPAAISSKLGPADWMTHSTCTSLFIITSNES